MITKERCTYATIFLREEKILRDHAAGHEAHEDGEAHQDGEGVEPGLL